MCVSLGAIFKCRCLGVYFAVELCLAGALAKMPCFLCMLGIKQKQAFCYGKAATLNSALSRDVSYGLLRRSKRIIRLITK